MVRGVVRLARASFGRTFYQLGSVLVGWSFISSCSLFPRQDLHEASVSVFYDPRDFIAALNGPRGRLAGARINCGPRGSRARSVCVGYPGRSCVRVYAPLRSGVVAIEPRQGISSNTPTDGSIVTSIHLPLTHHHLPNTYYGSGPSAESLPRTQRDSAYPARTNGSRFARTQQRKADREPYAGASAL